MVVAAEVRYYSRVVVGLDVVCAGGIVEDGDVDTAVVGMEAADAVEIGVREEDSAATVPGQCPVVGDGCNNFDDDDIPAEAVGRETAVGAAAAVEDDEGTEAAEGLDPSYPESLCH